MQLNAWDSHSVRCCQAVLEAYQAAKAWRRIKNKDGRYYWWNKSSNQTRFFFLLPFQPQ